MEEQTLDSLTAAVRELPLVVGRPLEDFLFFILDELKMLFKSM